MSPQEAKSVAEFLIADFEQEVETTQRVLAAVPADQLDYQPDAKAMTVLGLVRHITLEDEWMLNCIANGAFTQPPDDSDDCGIMNPGDAVARYKEKVPAALDRVRSMSGEQLTQVLDPLGLNADGFAGVTEEHRRFKPGVETVAVQAPALGWLAIAVKHSVHHRGQLSTYLRPMGGAVPSIYGPSADTQ